MSEGKPFLLSARRASLIRASGRIAFIFTFRSCTQEEVCSRRCKVWTASLGVTRYVCRLLSCAPALSCVMLPGPASNISRPHPHLPSLPPATARRSRSGTVFVSGARVLTPDLEAGPSVIHVIDRVLLPPSLEHLTSAFEGLVDALSAVNAHPRLGSLVGALTQAAGLQQPGKQQAQQAQQQQKQQKHGHHEHPKQRQEAHEQRAGRHGAQQQGRQEAEAGATAGNSRNTAAQQPGNAASALQPASSRRLQSLLGLGDLPELSTLIAGVLQLVQTPGLTAALRAPLTLFVPSNAVSHALAARGYVQGRAYSQSEASRRLYRADKSVA